MRTGASQIFSIGADGQREIRLTHTDSAELQPAWSAQGRIAFVSYRSGGGDIYTMNADGSDVRRVTSRSGLDQNPAWSPDGRRIAYVSERDGNEALCVINADGSGDKVISGSLTETGSPQWSPDGSQIAFVAVNDRRTHIHLADLKAGTVAALTSGNGSETGAVWSPDGRTIAYVQSSRGEGVNLRLLRLGSSDPVVLTGTAFTSSQPRFSPDGSKILFLSNAGTDSGLINLHVMNADGTGIANLTRWAHADLSAAWASDGRHIFLMSFRDFPGQIYRVSADGRDVQRLTRSAAQDGFPVARPPEGAVPGAMRANRAQ